MKRVRLAKKLENLRKETAVLLKSLKEKLSELEVAVDVITSEVETKGERMDKAMTGYTSKMQSEIRETIQRQLLYQSKHFYEQIGQMDNRINGISVLSTNQTGSLLDNIAQQSFSLVISGAGTIAHVIATCVHLCYRGIDTILHPYSSIVGTRSAK